MLRDTGWIETRQGVGNFICAGAREKIIEFGRKQFLGEEWPVLRQRLKRLRIAALDLQ